MGREAERSLHARINELQGQLRVAESRISVLLRAANDLGALHNTVRSTLRGSWPYRLAHRLAAWSQRLPIRWRARQLPKGYLGQESQFRDGVTRPGLKVLCSCGEQYQWALARNRACPKCGKRWEAQSQATETANRMEGRG